MPWLDIGGEELQNGVVQSVAIVVLAEWAEVVAVVDIEEEEDAKLRDGGCLSPRQVGGNRGRAPRSKQLGRHW